MGNFVDIAASVLSQSERRVEMSAQNVSNAMTPGYKRRISFDQVMAAGGAQPEPSSGMMPDMAPGKMSNTGNPYDFAITGDGFFVVNADGRQLYTRQGQFQRDGDGRLVTAQGYPVQAEGGGDITLRGGDFKVLDDGAVMEDGEPIARMAVVVFADPKAVTYAEGGMFRTPEEGVNPAATPMVRQGMLEASNVSMGDEMMSMMAALRRAETGQRLVSVYDDLMGRVLQAFGQA